MIRTTIRGTFGSGKTQRALSLAALHMMEKGDNTVLLINNEDRPDSLMIRMYKMLREYGVQRPNSERFWVHDSNDLERIKAAVAEFNPTLIVFDVEPHLDATPTRAIQRQRFQSDLAAIAGDVEFIETVSVSRPHQHQHTEGVTLWN